MTNHRTLFLLSITLLAVSAPCAAANPPEDGAKEKVLYRFHYPGATVPWGGVIFDSAGNLYGTTCGGYDGAGYGAVFMLTPGSDGRWSETVLHNFGYDCPTGGLVFDAVGNLYGATLGGGRYSNGTVFQLTPNSDGSWSKTALHEFGKGKDGKWPNGDLIFDANGNLYGTTNYGGTDTHGCADENGCGTVFELTPRREGQWIETVLHNFRLDGTDGAWPTAGLAMDSAGDLYGPTYTGGSDAFGIVFELSPSDNGEWTEKIVFNFDGKNGGVPSAKLILGSNGNLYGTSLGSEAREGVGNVFELTPQQNGQWTETIIRNFYHVREPLSPVLFDTAGNLYVTTAEGGHHSIEINCGGFYCGGSIFKLSPTANGGWTATVLHDFGANGDGFTPTGDLAMDAAGNIYGTTAYGGNSQPCYTDEGCGTVFEVTP